VTWIDEKIDGWISSVETLVKVAKRYPQTVYAGLTRSLQMEWQYTLRVVPEVAAQFERVESALANSFLPIVFGLNEVPVSEGLHVRAKLLARWSGAGIPDPSEIAKECYNTSTKALTEPLTHSLFRGTPWTLPRTPKEPPSLPMPSTSSATLKPKRRAPSWRRMLTAYTIYLNGTEQSANEFPCDGCGECFSINHALQ
jgi:hypothetical protein